jgi:hypothetical protein
VLAIRAYIFCNELKKSDERLMASLEQCFAGAALRWHSDLDDDVKADWVKLEKAIFRQFPAPEVRPQVDRCVLNSPTLLAIKRFSRTIPVAAAVAPVSTLTLTGYIKVNRSGSPGYIGKTFDSNGCGIIVNTIADALLVEVLKTGILYGLRILPKDGAFEFLGTGWYPKAYGVIGGIRLDGTTSFDQNSWGTPSQAWTFDETTCRIGAIIDTNTTSGRFPTTFSEWLLMLAIAHPGFISGSMICFDNSTSLIYKSHSQIVCEPTWIYLRLLILIFIDPSI